LHDVKVSPDVTPEESEAIYGGYRLDGLYVFGPAGIRCVLAALIAESLLLVSGSTPEGERRMLIRERADKLRRTYTIPALQAMEVARRQFRSGYGLFGRPTKPANSGRKRRVAA
jgi:hypothetical protein